MIRLTFCALEMSLHHIDAETFLEDDLIVSPFKLAETTKAKEWRVAQVCDCVLHQLYLL